MDVGGIVQGLHVDLRMYPKASLPHSFVRIANHTKKMN